MILLNFELSSSLSPGKISESLMSFCFMGKQKEYRITLSLMNVRVNLAVSKRMGPLHTGSG